MSYQHDSMQCGAACLRMVCKHYGKEYALDFLSEQCGCMIDGVSLQSIRETAEALKRHGLLANAGMVADCGLETEQVYTDLRQLPEEISYFATIVAD